MNEIEVTVARHDERISDLEKRSEERRTAEKEIFKKLDSMTKDMSKLSGKMTIWVPLIFLVCSVLANLAVKYMK